MVHVVQIYPKVYCIQNSERVVSQGPKALQLATATNASSVLGASA